MGTVYAEIRLVNVKDMAHAQAGLIRNEAIKAETVQAVVDTGAMSLVITEELRQKLGLEIRGEKSALVANGQRVTCQVTDPVDIHWKSRSSTQRALVVPGAKTILLGVIPLEDMDLIVNPVTQELVGAHGDVVEFMAY